MAADHLVELVVRHLQQRSVADRAGVVDDGIDAPVRVQCRVDEPLRDVAIADVTRDGRRGAELGRQRVKRPGPPA